MKCPYYKKLLSNKVKTKTNNNTKKETYLGEMCKEIGSPVHGETNTSNVVVQPFNDSEQAFNDIAQPPIQMTTVLIENTVAPIETTVEPIKMTGEF